MQNYLQQTMALTIQLFILCQCRQKIKSRLRETIVRNVSILDIGGFNCQLSPCLQVSKTNKNPFEVIQAQGGQCACSHSCFSLPVRF